MNRTKSAPLSRLAGAALGLAALVGPSPAGAQEAKPNILFILMDDLGYGEVGIYGGVTLAATFRAELGVPISGA